MKRNKIKPKYLKIIKPNNIESSNTIEQTIKKILITLMWLFLLLFWGIIPTIIIELLGINPNTLSTTTKTIISFINDIIFISILITYYYKDLKNNFKNYFNKNLKNNFKESISYWLIGLGIMIFSNMIIAIIMNGQLAQNEESVRELINIAPLYMVFQLVIYAPLTEELIFRKSIKDIIKNNKYLFAIISGLIFGGLHVISSLTNLTSLLYLIPYCSLGIVFGLLYSKTNNIFSTITIHAIHNSIALITYLTNL